MTVPSDDAPRVPAQFRAITAVLEEMDVAVYVADMETYELLFVNSYLEKTFGNVLGKTCYRALQSGQDGPCAFCTNSKLVRNGKPAKPVVWELQNTLSGQWVMCIDKAIRWTDGRLVRMEVAVDITDRKSAEQFRDQYVSLISHDLRNPLNHVSLKAEKLRRMLERKGLTEEAKAATQILASTQRINTMITDLVETTRLEAGQLRLHPRTVDLVQLAKAAVQRFTDAEARVWVEAEVETLSAWVDPDRIDRVIENLVGNGLRYSAPEEPVTLRLGVQAGEAILSVIDRGVGIAAEDLGKLFQRFVRARSAGKTEGLGLGLYIVRLIVERHGGRVWAESQPGEGSAFHVALPLEPPDPAKRPTSRGTG